MIVVIMNSLSTSPNEHLIIIDPIDMFRKGREVEKNVSSSSNDSHGVSTQPSLILITINSTMMSTTMG